MEKMFMVIGLIALILLIIGFFKPGVSLFFISDKSKRKKGLSAIIYLVIFVLCLILSPGSDSKEASGEKEASGSEVKEGSGEAEKAPTWTYSTSKDEMSGNEMFFAENESTNEVEFEFPYSGGSRMYLMIRNMDGENNVMIRVNKGQFGISVNYSEKIRIKFGDSEPISYSYSITTNGAPDLIFVDREADIINRLKTAKDIKIDAPFYNSGRVVFDFDVSGLKWDK